MEVENNGRYNNDNHSVDSRDRGREEILMAEESVEIKRVRTADSERARLQTHAYVQIPTSPAITNPSANLVGKKEMNVGIKRISDMRNRARGESTEGVRRFDSGLFIYDNEKEANNNVFRDANGDYNKGYSANEKRQMSKEGIREAIERVEKKKLNLRNRQVTNPTSKIKYKYTGGMSNTEFTERGDRKNYTRMQYARIDEEDEMEDENGDGEERNEEDERGVKRWSKTEEEEGEGIGTRTRTGARGGAGVRARARDEEAMESDTVSNFVASEGENYKYKRYIKELEQTPNQKTECRSRNTSRTPKTVHQTSNGVKVPILTKHEYRRSEQMDHDNMETYPSQNQVPSYSGNTHENSQVYYNGDRTYNKVNENISQLNLHGDRLMMGMPSYIQAKIGDKLLVDLESQNAVSRYNRPQGQKVRSEPKNIEAMDVEIEMEKQPLQPKQKQKQSPTPQQQQQQQQQRRYSVTTSPLKNNTRNPSEFDIEMENVQNNQHRGGDRNESGNQIGNQIGNGNGNGNENVQDKKKTNLATDGSTNNVEIQNEVLQKSTMEKRADNTLFRIWQARLDILSHRFALYQQKQAADPEWSLPDTTNDKPFMAEHVVLGVPVHLSRFVRVPKYGLGYELTNGVFGVSFRDKTSLLSRADSRDSLFLVHTGNGGIEIQQLPHTDKLVGMEQKLALYSQFEIAVREQPQLKGIGTKINSQFSSDGFSRNTNGNSGNNVNSSENGFVFVTKYLSATNVSLYRISNGAIQIKAMLQ
ncbi:hypothetical protein AX774_g4796 [Zancudomyces culisetae]|uniref:POLO box domain-containing protein n=1 Tax=Zancudomyces culisetae TaxID=1213189 RepID=A0A1R1PLJ5_ZANCU|nr:hypothetical protein AX774_g4796 [Zancudomyces culisetae]|eukprot:OMH81742.1 hypothetical protein AX774_g4796 [Zancudomyces culisetae]